MITIPNHLIPILSVDPPIDGLMRRALVWLDIRSIVEHLWSAIGPLFEPCHTSEQAITYVVDVPFSTTYGEQLIEGVERVKLTIPLCPTISMYILFMLAGMGLVFIVVGLASLLVLSVRGSFSTPAAQYNAHHDAVAAILKEMDKVSDDYLRRVHAKTKQ